MITAWISEWYVYVLKTLGFANREATVVVVGLDNAGKTTLLHRLKTGTVRSFAPTERVKEQSFKIGGVNFTGWDLGGHDAVRHLWAEYYVKHDAIVFMVDCTDVKRFEEAQVELEEILSDEDVDEIPVLILSNKIDRKDAVVLDDVIKAVGADGKWPDRKAPLRAFEVSILKGIGYEDAFQWLASQLP